MKRTRKHAFSSLAFTCLCAGLIAAACGGPKLRTLAPGVQADAGEAGVAGEQQAGSSGAASADGGAAGAAASEAGAQSAAAGAAGFAGP